MMSGMPLETCWAFNKIWNNKFYYKVASCWLFLLVQIIVYRSYQNLCVRTPEPHTSYYLEINKGQCYTLCTKATYSNKISTLPGLEPTSHTHKLGGPKMTLTDLYNIQRAKPQHGKHRTPEAVATMTSILRSSHMLYVAAWPYLCFISSS